VEVLIFKEGRMLAAFVSCGKIKLAEFCEKEGK